MNEEVKKKLEAAIVACADKATSAATSVEALQYTQAALNASHALTGLHLNLRM